jgi:hypothetical protein
MKVMKSELCPLMKKNIQPRYKAFAWRLIRQALASGDSPTILISIVPHVGR